MTSSCTRGRRTSPSTGREVLALSLRQPLAATVPATAPTHLDHRSSPGSVKWIADHQYVYACFLQPYEEQERLHQVYRERCHERGLLSQGRTNLASWPWSMW